MRYRQLGTAALLFLGACGGDSDEGELAPGGAGASAPDATAALFDESRISDVHLRMSATDWDSLVADDRGDEYRHTGFSWEGVELGDVAVRPSGHASRFPGNPKPSLKLKFNEFVPGQKFLGMKTLKLDGLIERSMMRERIAYGVYRTRLPRSPRVANCRLFINGSYQGLYLLEERVTPDLLEQRFGNADGYLYQVMVDFPEAFSWRGSDPAAYIGLKPFQAQTHETDGDHSVLPAFIDILQHRPAELGSVLDLDSLVDYLALEVALVSRDGLLRDDGPPQNCFIYRRPDTGLFEFIPWDVDQTLSDDGVGRSRFPIYYNFEKTRIASVVRESPALDARFRSRLAEFIGTLTHPDVLVPRIDAIYAQIRPYVETDPHPSSTLAEFDYNRQDLKRLVRERHAFLRSQLGLP